MLENGNRLTQIFLPLQINGKQFPVEAYYQRHICHPNIIQLLDVFTHKENFVYVLERPEDSSDLFDIMDVDDGMTEDDGRRFFTQILDATIQCEEQGILHRDIKPENIIIDLTNMDAKLTDFGLACETQEEPFRRFVGKSWKKNRPVRSLFSIYTVCVIFWHYGFKRDQLTDLSKPLCKSITQIDQICKRESFSPYFLTNSQYRICTNVSVAVLQR